jgi:hypothetical protein
MEVLLALANRHRRDFGLAQQLAERVLAMAQQAKAPAMLAVLITYWVLFCKSVDSYRQRVSTLNVPLSFSVLVRFRTMVSFSLKPLPTTSSLAWPCSVICQPRLAEPTSWWRVRAEAPTPILLPLLWP